MTATVPASLTLREAVDQVVTELDGPITRADLIARVLQRHETHARRPQDHVLAQVRQHPGMIRLDDGGFAPRNKVLQGLVFRYIPSPEEIRSGHIALFPCFSPILPDKTEASGGTSPVGLTLVDASTGEVVAPSVPEHARQRTHVASWLAAQGFAPGDSLIFTVTDPAQGIFHVRREAAAKVHLSEITAQDARLEATLFDLVNRDVSEQPFLEEIIPAAFARLSPMVKGYPGNHWHHVVAHSSRLRLVDDYALARATFRRPIDRLLGFYPTPEAQENLEARIDAFNTDLEQTLCVIGVQTPQTSLAPGLCGRDEALHRSTRQIATFLATHGGSQEDCYRCLAVPSIYLAKHEGTSLSEADFDMLYRFLLSYYPRRVFSNHKSFTRRMLSTLRRFYTAAQTNGTPSLWPAHHLPRLHGFVDRKIALYAELSMDGPDSARLFGKLFPSVEQDDAEIVSLRVGTVMQGA